MTVAEFLNKNGINTLEDYRHNEFANDKLVNEKLKKAGNGQKIRVYDLSNHPGHFAQFWFMLNAKGEKTRCFNIYKKEA